MDDFITLKNFKHLFKLLNLYSQEKYNTKLHFKNFKKIIGNSMYEINDNFGNKLTTKKKNILILQILKEIIDEKQQVDNFFQVEDNDLKTNIKQNDNIYNMQNYNYSEQKEQKEEINILEKKLEKEQEVYKKIIQNDSKIDIELKQKQDLEKYLKEIQMDKPTKEQVNMNEQIKNYNQEILINPDEYKKTINKYIEKVDLLIDSRDRNNNEYESNNYIIDLTEDIKNVFSIELINAIIPNSEYIVNLNNNLLYVEEVTGTIIPVEVEIGNYTKNELALAIQNALNANSSLNSTYSVTTDNVNIILNKVETTDENFIQYTGTNIQNIFNNNISEYWTTNLATNNPSFFIYDFKKPVLIKEYSFISKILSRPKDYNLEISNDLSNWDILQSVINQTSSNNRYKTYSFPNNNKFARYVKFTITNSSGGNLATVAINNMNFVSYSNTKIQIESDLIGTEQNSFNLRFLGGINIYNNNEVPYYKERSIGQLIGFLPADRTDLGFYSSDNDVILKNDKIIEININDEKFYIELDSNSGEYTYKNKINIVKILDKLQLYKKLNIKIKNTRGTFYNFNGLEHSLLLRMYYYNTNQVFIDSM